MIKNIFMTMIKNIIIIISIIAMNIIFSIGSFEIELSFIYLSTNIRHHYDYHDHMMIWRAPGQWWVFCRNDQSGERSWPSHRPRSAQVGPNSSEEGVVAEDEDDVGDEDGYDDDNKDV